MGCYSYFIDFIIVRWIYEAGFATEIASRTAADGNVLCTPVGKNRAVLW